MKKKQRENLTISIKSSLNLPSPCAIRRDLNQLIRNRAVCFEAIRAYKRKIVDQKVEQKELWELSLNPGIYKAAACAKSALRCEDHIKMFEATIKKEQAKVEQFDRMIKKLEERLLLSEQTSRSTGNPVQG